MHTQLRYVNMSFTGLQAEHGQLPCSVSFASSNKDESNGATSTIFKLL